MFCFDHYLYVCSYVWHIYSILLLCQHTNPALRTSTQPTINYKGEVLSFLGANGAGKSTTMAMLSGTIKPTVGDATVGGKSIIIEKVRYDKIDEGGSSWRVYL